MSSAPFEFTSRILPLAPGMYIFRFASQLEADQQVFIALQQSPAGKGGVDLFAATDVRNNTLSKLGDCIVARVAGEGACILITQYSPSGQRHSVVDLRVDRIDTTQAIVRARPAPALVPDAPVVRARPAPALVADAPVVRARPAPVRVPEAPVVPIPAQRPKPAARRAPVKAKARRS